MISTAWALWFTLFLPGLFGGHYGQPSAALWKDQLFVAINGSNVAGGKLYRGTFSPVRKNVHSPVEHVNWYGGDLSSLTQAKLQIQGDRVLLCASGHTPRIFPMAEVPLLEANEFGEELCKLRGYRSQSHLNDRSSGDSQRLLFPIHRKHDVPAPPTRNELFGNPTPEQVQWQRESDFRQRARFDVQIAGARSLRLLFAHEDRLFVSVEYDYLRTWYWDHFDKHGDEVKPLPKPPDRQLRTGKLPADFTESFAAYTTGERDYFVTPTGKVYMAVAKGKTEVEVSAVWTDPKRPIAGVVQDHLTNDAVYGWGFVTNNRAPERFYVKLEPKPVAVPYKRTVPLWGDRSDAYLESYECARAFRKK